MLEMKINKLKAELASAKIIDTSKLDKNVVQILATVEMENKQNGAKMKYTIVSESEANLKEGKISSRTPIAQGLLGKRVGDEVVIQIPRGEIHLKIVSITY
jgi:transcription elongation factor GreA